MTLNQFNQMIVHKLRVKLGKYFSFSSNETVNYILFGLYAISLSLLSNFLDSKAVENVRDKDSWITRINQFYIAKYSQYLFYFTQTNSLNPIIPTTKTPKFIVFIHNTSCFFSSNIYTETMVMLKPMLNHWFYPPISRVFQVSKLHFSYLNHSTSSI